ncbi:MAG: caspase family protein [Proteobacteria bacterium]|nr:caspase family protein [Pseudomonadota bacterium]MBU4287967.1 caspase family protein [Pseudomonadota bacterium]MBU4413943.1 caspase family protein [Pseudomonadota bacterium]MCG2756966.1 caspase family protein [Desulfobacteraceae bacterium]
MLLAAKRLLISLFICLLLIDVRVGIAEDRAIAVKKKEDRVALVIGNSDYKTAPLANPANDASDMASSLSKCGFNVIKYINCSKQQMRRAIREFGEKIRSGGVGLFYYAGHGLQVNGVNYLVPVDADVNVEYEVEDECVQASSVLGAMEYAGNRLNIVILDACRNNPLKRSFRSGATGLARMDAPAGSLIAYATAPGSVAADGTGRNGLYTSNLMKYMMIPGLSIEEMFKNARLNVMNATNKAQVPWESSSMTGDFYFIPGGAIQKKPLAQPLPPTPSIVPKVPHERFYLASKGTGYIKKSNRFVKEGNNIIFDTLLKKKWLVTDSDEIFSWEQAKEYCKNLDGNFRLPTKFELQSLITKKKLKGEWGRIDGDFFPMNNRSEKYWTSTGNWLDGYDYVDFNNGTSDTMSKTNYCAVIAISD